MRRAKHFLTEQRVASVAGAVGPDLARFGEVHDVLGVVLRPADVLLAWGQWRAHRVDARHDALGVFLDLLIDRHADAGHDAHVDDGVGGVGELHADLRHGRADGAHRERHHVHGAAAHRAAKERLELLAHDEGIFPVVGGAGIVLGERTDEGAVLHAGDIVGRAAGVEAARPLGFREPGEGAGLDQPIAEPGVLFCRAIDPVDASRLAEIGHLVDPADEVFVGGGRGESPRGNGAGELGGHGSWVPRL